MSNKKRPDNDSRLLKHLGNASKSIIQHHHRDNLAEFVLHDLCSQQGFNIRKAAYLVNNPDFSCLKGVAGYHAPELFEKTTWEFPKDFTAHMQQAPFNQRVRSYMDNSLSTHLLSPDFSKLELQELVALFEIDDAAYHTWQAKHNNQGILIFERPHDYGVEQDHLLNFLHMLSFCPII